MEAWLAEKHGLNEKDVLESYRTNFGNLIKRIEEEVSKIQDKDLEKRKIVLNAIIKRTPTDHELMSYLLLEPRTEEYWAEEVSVFENLLKSPALLETIRKQIEKYQGMSSEEMKDRPWKSVEESENWVAFLQDILISEARRKFQENKEVVSVFLAIMSKSVAEEVLC